MDAQYTGNQISQLRKGLKLTQRELAEKLHVTDKAVSKWERGVNFPDLGLMENLAEALDTTPAVLLGLENADQQETLSALAEISAEQLEEAKSDLRIFSWGSLAAAILLSLVDHLMNRNAVEGYYLLTGLILLLGHTGWWYLFKYSEIKKWEPRELGTFSGAMLPVLIWNGWYFLTGYNLSPVLTGILIAVASVFAQIHFLQVMRPRFMQALPLLLSALYGLWQAVMGGIRFLEAIPLVCCLAVWLCHVIRHPGHWKIKWKAFGIVLCIILLLVFFICLVCYTDLVQVYVSANRERLEAYAMELLENGQYDTYGLWDVTAYPELGVVQFQTGGSGIGSETNYEGFYYSLSGEHVPLPGFEGSSEYYGSDAWFRDPVTESDNFQKSTELFPNWFWFTLHY